MRSELVHGTARALIIEILLHTAQWQIKQNKSNLILTLHSDRARI